MSTENQVRLVHADEESLQQLYGRYMECVDIRTQIEEGKFKSLGALAKHLRDLENRIDQTILTARSGSPVAMTGPFFTLND
ncbi:hypothetical protein [Cupriavidus metallidurans]|uniref:hypothetical protein n=1 Tax=Cupriavidus metallidurans TaxID=119219 RepID=UPI001319D52A|nr:hypothetical protein [Cupriavidus metallidurans]